MLIGQHTSAEISVILEIIESISEDTKHFSFHDPARNHPKYKQLLALGDTIVPVLLHNLKYNPSWVVICLLYDITNIELVTEDIRGRFQPIVTAWLTWGYDSHYSRRIPSKEGYAFAEKNHGLAYRVCSGRQSLDKDCLHCTDTFYEGEQFPPACRLIAEEIVADVYDCVTGTISKDIYQSDNDKI